MQPLQTDYRAVSELLLCLPAAASEEFFVSRIVESCSQVVKQH